MKAKNVIQLYWAINNCIEDFFKENPAANSKEYFLSINRAWYGWKWTTGNPYEVKLLHKSEADISTMPCLNGLCEDYVDDETGEVETFAHLETVSEVIDDWFGNNR